MHHNLLGVDSGFIVGRRLAVGVYPAGRSTFVYYLFTSTSIHLTLYEIATEHESPPHCIYYIHGCLR